MDFYFYFLSQIKMDHSTFDNLEKGLKGEIIVNKLFDDFDVLTMEMTDMEIPLDPEWKDIERVGRTKYRIPPNN